MSFTTLPTGHRILEGVVTTVSDPAGFSPVDGSRDPALLPLINIAPMGPIVDEAMTSLVLRPFTSSTTYQNLKRTGQGVFHVTDDVLLMARGAIGKLAACWEGESRDDAGVPVRHADHVRGVVLTGGCRYYELEVVQLDDSQDRTRIEARVIHTGVLRDFFGFNRAKHAVLEAAILATRLHLTGIAPVLAQFDHLQSAIDKTGSETEHQAINELRTFVMSKQKTDV